MLIGNPLILFVTGVMKICFGYWQQKVFGEAKRIRGSAQPRHSLSVAQAA